MISTWGFCTGSVLALCPEVTFLHLRMVWELQREEHYDLFLKFPQGSKTPFTQDAALGQSGFHSRSPCGRLGRLWGSTVAGALGGDGAHVRPPLQTCPPPWSVGRSFLPRPLTVCCLGSELRAVRRGLKSRVGNLKRDQSGGSSSGGTTNRGMITCPPWW